MKKLMTKDEVTFNVSVLKKLGKQGIRVILFCFITSFALPAIGAEPAKIAAIFAKTGIAAANNAPYSQMIELAVEELNNQGGLLGHPVELILLDNISTPLGSKLAAKKAVKLQVTAVIGAIWSSHSLAAGPVLQEAGIPMITPISTNPKVTGIGNYVFRICFIDSFQGKAMARFAYDELGAKNAIVLEIINEQFSLTLAEYFVKSFTKYGGNMLLKSSYKNDAVDFAVLLKKVKKLQPDVVYVPGYARDSGLLIKQAVSMGIRTTFLGGDGWNLIYDYGGDTIEGNFHSAAWHPSVPYAKSIHLQKIYSQKYKNKLTHTGAPLAYDAVMLLADAVKRAGTLDRSGIRNALAETQGFQGAAGTVTFDKQGDPLNKEVIILKLEKGGAAYFKSVKP
ncbi:ABC transporter substrate-binding protein [Desulfococcaceae bacterium HSG7]|nr:ABC transporter substrate-binding protein [Desulfococcaceae bacterium HSG7]